MRRPPYEIQRIRKDVERWPQFRGNKEVMDLCDDLTDAVALLQWVVDSDAARNCDEERADDISRFLTTRAVGVEPPPFNGGTQ